MKRVFIIHGCPDEEEHGMSPEERSYDKHWMPWLQAELEKKGIEAHRPMMPNPWEPDYEAYKKEFDKFEVAEDDILIGHSCGAAFLVRWLGDSKQKIKKLILVAPWKIADEEIKEVFYNYPIDISIPSRVGEIVMFTSDNEEEEGKRSLKMFHDVLGGKIINLPNHGHYTLEDMRTEEFPELLEQLEQMMQ